MPLSTFRENSRLSTISKLQSLQPLPEQTRAGINKIETIIITPHLPNLIMAAATGAFMYFRVTLAASGIGCPCSYPFRRGNLHSRRDLFSHVHLHHTAHLRMNLSFHPSNSFRIYMTFCVGIPRNSPHNFSLSTRILVCPA